MAWSGARTFHGHSGVGAWMDQFGSDLSLLGIEPLEFEEQGDSVYRARQVHDRRRGLDFAIQVTWVFSIAEGQAYQTMDEARDAVVS